MAPPELRAGEKATHDLLGEGTIIAIGSTQQVAEGVLTGGAAFESLNLAGDKIRFIFTKRERVSGTGPKRYVDKEVTRDVFADALTVTPLEPATASGSAGPSSAFETMTTAAAGAHAFTHGLDDVEMAAHERKRKVSKLKDAP
eukprot:7381586-Prymnesium_polylepis.1